MLLHQYNYGFSVPVMFHSKAQCAGKGFSPGKHCNAAEEHHRGALWVSVSVPADCVAPLDRGMAFAGEARLVANTDTLTELAIILLKEH